MNRLWTFFLWKYKSPKMEGLNAIYVAFTTAIFHIYPTFLDQRSFALRATRALPWTRQRRCLWTPLKGHCPLRIPFCEPTWLLLHALCACGLSFCIHGGLDRDHDPCYAFCGRKETTGSLLLGSTKAKGVIRMSDFELLTIVFTVMALLISVYELNNRRK